MKILHDIERSLLTKKDNTYFEYALLDNYTTIQNLQERLDELYQTPWCDPAYLNIQDSSFSGDSCFKLFLYENEILKHIILFQKKGERYVLVQNHCFKITLQEIEIIRDIFFSEYRNVRKIKFPFLFLDQVEKRPRMILFQLQTDMIIELPESMDIYMKMLGQKTRKRIKDCQKSIEKDYPDFNVSFHEGEDISREQIFKIVELNRDRMVSKGKTCLNDNTICENIFRYARSKGGLCICTVNKNVIGGTINYVLGEHAYLYIIAHDHAYSKYNAGFIALACTIKYLIEKKMKYYHLLWGDGTEKGNYKSRFLGENHWLHDVIIYRNNADFFLNSIYFAVRKLIKTIKDRVDENTTLMKIYRKIRNLFKK